MIFERPTLMHQFGEKPANSHQSARKSKDLTTFRPRDPALPLVAGPGLSPDSPESIRWLKLVIDCVRKVLVQDQAAIIVMVPHLVYWVTQNSEQELGDSADDVTKITEALEGRLGGPNSELVAEHVVRASTRAQLGIQNRSTIELRASARSYKVDIDCYFDDPDFHAIVALLSPLSDNHKTGYEETQLSSLRYHIGILNSRQARQKSMDEVQSSIGPRVLAIEDPLEIQSSCGDVNKGSGKTGAARHVLGGMYGDGMHGTLSSLMSGSTGYAPGAGYIQGAGYTHSLSGHGLGGISMAVPFGQIPFDVNGNPKGQYCQAMDDFIPTMSTREVEYFYSMIPGTSTDWYSSHESELAKLHSINDEERLASDPDNFDPHSRIRLLQQRSLTPILPRRPRKLAEVQAELEQAARSFSPGGLGPRHGTAQKKNEVKCLQCGADSSPEWRKGPMGPKTLCNRCGLRYAKKLRGLVN